MAAGDIVIRGDFIFGSKSKGSPRILFGHDTLDGTNATAVALSSYLSDITESPIHGVVSLQGSSSPNMDPLAVTSAVSTTTLNVYAWKANAADNCNLEASTNNTAIVDWVVFGPSA